VRGAAVDERDGVARFVVMLDAASASPVSVNYATSDGSALAGGDYLSRAGTLLFTPA